MSVSTAVRSTSARSTLDRSTTVRLTEIFHSIQGESTRVGLPTVFVRLTGCPLRCEWCDTAYAFQGGQHQSIDEILSQVAQHQCPTVCVTGGEPLAQRNCHDLLTALCDDGYSVSLETSGALSVQDVDPRVVCIMDLKAPGSGEVDKNLWDNLTILKPQDEIKIVLRDRADYEWARDVLKQHQLINARTAKHTILLSPVAGALAPADLAQWILDDHLPVRMQVQLHKIIWGNVSGR